MTSAGPSIKQANLAELRAGSAQSLAVMTGLVGGVWLLAAIASVDVAVPLASWAGALALLLASVAGLTIYRRCPIVVSTLLILSIAIAATCVMVVTRSLHGAYLFLAAVIFSGVLLSHFALFTMALLAVGLVFFVGTGPLGQSLATLNLWLVVGNIAMISVTAWLAAYNLSTALDWVLVGYELALRNERLARERRAELRRTVNALEQATERLERTNRELVAARRQAEEARALKVQFVANVSHELRTPLNMVVGFAEMMYVTPESYEGVTWSPDLLSDVGAMFRAGRQLQRLVDDVLDLSRIDAARLPMFREQTDIAGILMDAVETMTPLLSQHGLPCRLQVPEDLPPLLVDRTRLRQVMLNLLNNAIRFTEKGEIVVEAALEDEAVVIGVRDTGIGIAPSQLEHVFEEFRQAEEGTRRRGGAGLGLAISRRFVEMHGGRLWAESQVGVGSVFRFSLPLPGSRPQSVALRHVPDRRRADRPNMPVVVVDPDSSVAQMLSRYLGDRTVIPADTTAEADALIPEQHPLAVVVNQTPTTPSAEWLASSGTNSQQYGVPVIRCSVPSPSWLASDIGIAECLTKPISRDTLIQAVRRHLKEPASVLIVDDSPGFVTMIGRMLRAAGLVRSLLTAHSGEEAIRLAREQTPDLMLLDLILPDIDGFEVLDVLRREEVLDGMVVIAVTATTYAEDVMQRRGERLTITTSGGLETAQVAEVLRAVLQAVQPDYAPEAITDSRA